MDVLLVQKTSPPSNATPKPSLEATENQSRPFSSRRFNSLENPSTVDVGIEVLDVKVLDLDHGVLLKTKTNILETCWKRIPKIPERISTCWIPMLGQVPVVNSPCFMVEILIADELKHIPEVCFLCYRVPSFFKKTTPKLTTSGISPFSP